jgi:beta-glucanase (GH16 family)
VRDSAEAKKHEIVVDNCDREGVKKISDYTTYDIYNDGVKLFINGGRNYSVVYALQLIIDDISGDNDIDAAASSGQYSNEDTYRLIWTDEFDKGESYNKEFWNDADYAEPSLGNYYGMIPYRSDSLKNLYVKDGAIHHAASYDDEYFYGTFMTTKNKVMFTYGFAEISAKLADGEGLWHCFWLWDAGVTTGGNLLEFDVMECWSGAQYYLNVVHETVGGILQEEDTGTINNKTHSYVTIDHAWKNNSGLEFWRDEKKDRRPERLMSEQFHTFSVLWDEERVAFYRDGTCTLDFNYAVESENLHLYRNPHYIILSYAVGSNKQGHPDDADNESKQMSGVKRPVLDADYWYNGKNIFSVDYVQLFQKDDWYHKIG